MEYISSFTPLWLSNGTADIAALYAGAVAALLVFIWARRVLRGRYFARRDARAFAIRRQWPQILDGTISPERWRNRPLDREVVETIVLDSIDAAATDELPPLLNFLRTSGLLDVRLHEARATDGWRRRSALVALGRTRSREAIAPLVDALSSPDLDMRTAATRGLGEIGLPEAAAPLLERLSTHELDVPAAVVSAALVNCCDHQPRALLRYFHITTGKERELLARVLSESDLASLGEELISLAKDESPEVRASAARGLPKLHPSIAIPMLTELTEDESWFVRLRAVVSLGAMDSPDVIKPLVRMLCDSNRLVRQRAAAALVRRSEQLRSILDDAIALQDRYGLQALLSELERSGESEPIIRSLRESGSRTLIAAIQRAREALRVQNRGSESTAGLP